MFLLNFIPTCESHKFHSYISLIKHLVSMTFNNSLFCRSTVHFEKAADRSVCRQKEHCLFVVLAAYPCQQVSATGTAQRSMTSALRAGNPKEDQCLTGSHSISNTSPMCKQNEICAYFFSDCLTRYWAILGWAVMQWSLYCSLIWSWLSGGVCPVSTCLSVLENSGELRFW